MAAFTLLALSTNCYKLSSLLKPIQHVIILFPSLTLLKIWIVSSVIPLVHNFFHRACSSMNWSWNLLSIKVVEGSGSQTRRRFLALLWTYLSPSSGIEDLFLHLAKFPMNWSWEILSIKVVVVKPNMATVCGTFVQFLAPPLPNLWDQTTL